MPKEKEETPEEKADREAREERRGNLYKKRKAKNKTKRDILIKAKYGNDTDKTNLGTTIFGGSFISDDFTSGQTKVNFTIDPCPAGDYIVEWYVEVEGNGDKPTGRLRHNKVQKKQGKARKNGDLYNFFNGLEEITIVENMEPQLFEIDLEKVGGGKAKMQEGNITVYRKETYIPPVIIPDPSNPVIPPFPID